MECFTTETYMWVLWEINGGYNYSFTQIKHEWYSKKVVPIEIFQVQKINNIEVCYIWVCQNLTNSVVENYFNRKSLESSGFYRIKQGGLTITWTPKYDGKCFVFYSHRLSLSWFTRSIWFVKHRLLVDLTYVLNKTFGKKYLIFNNILIMNNFLFMPILLKLINIIQ